MTMETHRSPEPGLAASVDRAAMMDATPRALPNKALELCGQDVWQAGGSSRAISIRYH